MELWKEYLDYPGFSGPTLKFMAAISSVKKKIASFDF
jgi:hypothetical protein